jgi:hypothetical protein
LEDERGDESEREAGDDCAVWLLGIESHIWRFGSEEIGAMSSSRF